MLKITLIAAAGAMLPVSALASMEQAPAGGEKLAAEPDKKVCRRMTLTGSNFARRVCHTTSQWNAIDDAGERQAQAYGNRERLRADLPSGN